MTRASPYDTACWVPSELDRARTIGRRHATPLPQSCRPVPIANLLSLDGRLATFPPFDKQEMRDSDHITHRCRPRCQSIRAGKSVTTLPRAPQWPFLAMETNRGLTGRSIYHLPCADLRRSQKLGHAVDGHRHCSTA